MSFVRKDILKDRKGFFVKLDPEMHSELRIWTFKHGISVQELFSEIARLIVQDDKKINALVDGFMLRKLGLPQSKRKYSKKKIEELGELDKNSLYDLISADSQEESLEIDQENYKGNVR